MRTGLLPSSKNITYQQTRAKPGAALQTPSSFIISFNDSVSEPFPPTALRRRHAQTVKDSSSSYKKDYVIVVKTFLNHEGHQIPISGSKVTVILLKGCILPFGGALAVKGLRSTGLPRLVYRYLQVLFHIHISGYGRDVS